MWDFWAPGFWAEGFWAEGFWLEAPSEPEQPPQGGVGPIKLRRPAVQSAPWNWVPFQPVPAKRPRKKRDADLLLIGH